MIRVNSTVFSRATKLVYPLIGLILLLIVSISATLIAAPQASAITQAECIAKGDQWLPGPYSYSPGTCQGSKADVDDKAKCEAIGGRWGKAEGMPRDSCLVKGGTSPIPGATKESCEANGGTWDSSLAVSGKRCQLNEGAMRDQCKVAGIADTFLSECVDGIFNKTDYSYCSVTYAGNDDRKKACYRGQGNDAIPECIAFGHKGAALEACTEGNKNKGNTTFCTKYSGAAASGASSPMYKACTDGQLASASPVNMSINAASPCNTDPDAEGCEEADGVASSCMVEQIGWIICPVVGFIGMITDASYEVIEGMLTTPASMFNTDRREGEAVYEAWSVMRTIANVAFVLAFLFIIFSQLTSVGISNYGVKKLVPKLVVSVILVNASFIISALAVDASNIVGSFAKGLFDGIASGITVSSTDDVLSATFNGGNLMTNVAGGILAGTIAVGASMYVGLAALLPIIIASAAAVLLVVVVLLMRQALIILLIVISPLAFVALLLPNTEGWFKKWRGLLFTLLAMFPIVGAIFGASALAGKIIMLSSTNPLVQLMGAGITLIPLIITPVIMKAAGGVLNRFAGLVNNTDKGVFDRMKNRASDFRDRRQNTRAANAMTGRPVFGGGQFKRSNRRRLKNEEASSAMDAASAGFGMTDDKANESLNTIAQNKLAANAVNAARSKEINEGVANETIQPGLALGEEAAAMPKIQVAIQQQAAKAIAEELKGSLSDFAERVAQHKAAGGNPDTLMLDQARNKAAPLSDQHAAMHYAASMGRSKVIRELGDDPTVDKTALQQALGSNAGGLLGKAPDLIKGPDAAFGTVNGSQMSKFSPDTTEKQMDYMVKLHGEVDKHAIGSDARKSAETALKQATDAFNGAVQDISLDTSLQADFTGDSGVKIRNRYDAVIKDQAKSGSTAFKDYAEANLKGLKSIGSDGKIR